MPELTTTDGAVVAFRDEGRGVPILLVPGICCSTRWWEPVRRALAADARVVCIDLRGVGGSPNVGHGHRVARYGRDVAELMEALDLRGTVLVGWSLGFSVSLACLELAGQGRLGALVLVEGSPRLLNGGGWTLGLADLRGAVELVEATRRTPAAAAEALVRSSFADPAAVPDLDRLLADALAADPESTARLLWDHLQQDWRDLLPTIRVPTVVAAGTASRILTPDAARWTAARVPGARLQLFEGAGHALFREQPDPFAAMLRGLVAATGGAG